MGDNDNSASRQATPGVRREVWERERAIERVRAVLHAPASPRQAAPGVGREVSERDRAIEMARAVLRAPDIDRFSEIALLARQTLRALGVSEDR